MTAQRVGGAKAVRRAASPIVRLKPRAIVMSGRRTDDMCRTMPWASIVRRLPVPGVGGRHDQYFGEIEALHHLLFELGVRPHVRRHDHRNEAGLPGLFDEPRYLDTRQARGCSPSLGGSARTQNAAGLRVPGGLEGSPNCLVVRTADRVRPFCRHEPRCVRTLSTRPARFLRCPSEPGPPRAVPRWGRPGQPGTGGSGPVVPLYPSTRAALS